MERQRIPREAMEAAAHENVEQEEGSPASGVRLIAPERRAQENDEDAKERIGALLEEAMREAAPTEPDSDPTRQEATGQLEYEHRVQVVRMPKVYEGKTPAWKILWKRLTGGK